MASNVNSMSFSYEVFGMDFKTAGQCATKIKKVLQQIGVNNSVIRRVAIIVYEVELNIVIHAFSGMIKILIAPEYIEVNAEDSGPGIADIEKAMTEGFSTAPAHVREMGFGAGMGLPNIRKSADVFEITSKVGSGTKLRARVLNIPA